MTVFLPNYATYQTKGELGHFIKDRRIELGYSQTTLARIVNRSPQYISAIECGSYCNLTSDFLATLAQTLNCTTDDIIWRSYYDKKPTDDKPAADILLRRKLSRQPTFPQDLGSCGASLPDGKSLFLSPVRRSVGAESRNGEADLHSSPELSKTPFDNPGDRRESVDPRIFRLESESSAGNAGTGASASNGTRFALICLGVIAAISLVAIGTVLPFLFNYK